MYQYADLRILKACEITRFSETSKTPRCPFCYTLYTSDREERPEIDCVACRGKGSLAKELETLLVLELDQSCKCSNVDRIREIAEMFPDTYFARRAKAALAKIEVTK